MEQSHPLGVYIGALLRSCREDRTLQTVRTECTCHRIATPLRSSR
jgi:hypothetical protein